MYGRTVRKCLLVLGFLGVLCLAGTAVAYEQYSEDGDATNCRACHGDFRSNPYVEPDTLESWGDDAHDMHRNTMLGGDCLTCHTSGPRFPVLLDSSSGGANLDPISCTGCHGRAEDGDGDGTTGWGAGLRQHHWNLNLIVSGTSTRVCGDCHANRADLGAGVTDADPGNFTPVGEHVLPPYYADVDGGLAHPAAPKDACSDPTNALAPDEDYAGTARGLDNDGDLVYDTSDTDCAGVVPAPGETAGPTLPLMTVTAHNAGASLMSLSYGNACDATDNAIIFGPLSGVSTYSYTGGTCSVGSSGTVTDWDYSAAPDSFFFLLVGQTGTAEGSYGTRSGGVERLSDDLLGPPACPLPQDLPNRCD